jgi:hypothetical protein
LPVARAAHQLRKCCTVEKNRVRFKTALVPGKKFDAALAPVRASDLLNRTPTLFLLTAVKVFFP